MHDESARLPAEARFTRLYGPQPSMNPPTLAAHGHLAISPSIYTCNVQTRNL